MRNPLLLTPAALLASFNMSAYDATTTSTTTPGVLFGHHDGSSLFSSVNTRHYVCPPSECDWALIVTLRNEDCILDNIDKQPSKKSLEGDIASLCPVLVDGYSVYATTTTTTDAPLFTNVTSHADIPLDIFLLGRDTYRGFAFELQNSFTYGDLVEWSQSQTNVYRGKATQFSELTVYDDNFAVEGFSVSVKGHAKDSRGYSRTFHMHAQQGGEIDDEFWHVEIEYHEHACRTCNFGNQAIIPLVAIVVIILSCTLFVVCHHREKQLWEEEDDDSLWPPVATQKPRTDTVPDVNEDDREVSSA